MLRARTYGVSDRTSSGFDLTAHHELRPAGPSPADADASDDCAFLTSLGIEPYDVDSLSVKAPIDLESVLIRGLALIQFVALLAGVIWTYLRLG